MMIHDASGGSPQTARWVTTARSGPDDAVFAVRIDRPPVNALGAGVRSGLLAAAGVAARDRTIKVVTISGNDHCFSAGGDIDELGANAGGPEGDAARLHDEYLAVYEQWKAIPVPVLAGIRRYAFGGALELALSCDIRFCTPDATFAAAGVRMGLVESAHSLPKVIGAGAAALMLFTAEPVAADEALRLGLVDTVASDVETLLAATADRIALHSGPALRATKRVLALANGGEPATAVAAQAKSLWRELQRGDDHARSVTAFLARRGASQAQ
jgi:2-(1,2-epoxy-1,2-dihydrophenyl)acetyl-CoA isomerase